jgi:hypothetical protein
LPNCSVLACKSSVKWFKLLWLLLLHQFITFCDNTPQWSGLHNENNEQVRVTQMVRLVVQGEVKALWVMDLLQMNSVLYLDLGFLILLREKFLIFITNSVLTANFTFNFSSGNNSYF